MLGRTTPEVAIPALQRSARADCGGNHLVLPRHLRDLNGRLAPDSILRLPGFQQATARATKCQKYISPRDTVRDLEYSDVEVAPVKVSVGASYERCAMRVYPGPPPSHGYASASSREHGTQHHHPPPAISDFSTTRFAERDERAAYPTPSSVPSRTLIWVIICCQL